MQNSLVASQFQGRKVYSHISRNLQSAIPIMQHFSLSTYHAVLTMSCSVMLPSLQCQKVKVLAQIQAGTESTSESFRAHYLYLAHSTSVSSWRVRWDFAACVIGALHMVELKEAPKRYHK